MNAIPKKERLTNKIVDHEQQIRNNDNIKEDCQELIKQTNYNLKFLKYNLSTLVTSGEGHVNLLEGKFTDIEIFPSTLIYAMVFIKNKPPPLTVHIKYLTKGDMKVF